MARLSRELRARKVRVEQEILATNPCCREFLADVDFSSAVETVLIVACTPVAFGLQTLFPKLRPVVALETIGLFINSKAKGRVKLAMTFPGYEHLKGKELKLGDASVMYDDELLLLPPEVEVAS